MTTIRELEGRIELAEQVQREMNGEKQGGLQVGHIDRYVIVDDGQDRWIVESADYDEACEQVIGDICDGDITGDDRGYCEWYNALCQQCSCIYSRIGSPSDLNDVAELDVSEEVKTQLFDALSEDYEEWLTENNATV